jgi:hypothetical protein
MAALVAMSVGSAAPSSAEMGDQSWVSVTPRTWLAFVDTIDYDVLVKKIEFVPMFGGSVAITPPMLPGFSVIFTGLYGTGGDYALFRDLSLVPSPVKTDADIERRDLELLLRYQIPDSPVSVFLGPRFVDFDEEYTFGAFRLKSESEVIAIEVGLGVAGDLDDDGRHRYFGNIMTGAAFEDSTYQDNVYPTPEVDSEKTNPMLDLNLGYQYAPTSWLSMSLRYRLFVLFGEDDFGQSTPFSTHGPELGLTMRF